MAFQRFSSRVAITGEVRGALALRVAREDVPEVDRRAADGLERAHELDLLGARADHRVDGRRVGQAQLAGGKRRGRRLVSGARIAAAFVAGRAASLASHPRATVGARRRIWRCVYTVWSMCSL